MDLENKIREFALENAVKFNGKANPGAVVGKVLALDPANKTKMQEINVQIQKIVGEVNGMSPDAQHALLLKLNPDFEKQQQEKKKENKEKRHELPELEGAVDGKVITRIAPEPSKYNHLGHAISFLLNYMYAQRYHGKCYLKFDDTNPDKSTQEYVDAVRSDVLEYLGIKVDREYFVSDNMEKYLERAKELIEKGHAYTCADPAEKMSAERREMIDNPDRNKPVAQVMQEWNDMNAGKYPEGSMTLRLKVSMQHKNAVMRDPVIYRICTAPHYRQGTKYKVWPMYDFATAIEDADVTHVLRSNEFETRIELQNYIRSLFNLPNPVIKQYARYNVSDAITQGREIREKIEKGEYSGWDDPRLVTLRALKRRGIRKEAFNELAIVAGMSKNGGELDFSVISSINRKQLDDECKRFFFIENGVGVRIIGAPSLVINLEMHPTKKMGIRTMATSTIYYLEKKDVDSFQKGEMIRLMDNLNFIWDGKDGQYVSDKYDDFKGKGTKIIHYLPTDGDVPVKIVMPDNTSITGAAEPASRCIKPGEVVQFERFGFCKCEGKDGKYMLFRYTHE